MRIASCPLANYPSPFPVSKRASLLVHSKAYTFCTQNLRPLGHRHQLPVQIGLAQLVRLLQLRGKNCRDCSACSPVGPGQRSPPLHSPRMPPPPYVDRLGDTAPLNLVYLAQGRRLPSTRRGVHAFPSIPPCTKCTGAGKHTRQKPNP